jgi:TPR repeat protein
MTGDGVDVDKLKGIKWWTLAAKAGNADAQENLGFCYKFGNGVAIDIQESKKWFAMAAVPR